MNKRILIIFLIIASSLGMLSLDQFEDIFKITKKDVKLIYPAHFPKPSYSFSSNKLSPDKFVLGRKLFYDEILSKDNTVSCATCHERIAAFAHIDHKLSHGIYAKIGTRNVPPIQNLIWRTSFMWEGGVNHIEIQPLSPIENPIEMDEKMSNVLLKLKNDPVYVSLFKKAYKDSEITSERIFKSLTQFMGLMISSNSRYDKFIQQKDTLSKMEMNGLTLFRAKCASCHTEPLFTNNGFANNGLKVDPSLNDEGRYKITKNEKDKYAFTIPSLRNIEMTYPYMHDGRFKKIMDVLNFYSEGQNHNATVDQRVTSIGKLSSQEKKELNAFLLTLTDKTFLYDRRFVDPDYVFSR